LQKDKKNKIKEDISFIEEIKFAINEKNLNNFSKREKNSIIPYENIIIDGENNNNISFSKSLILSENLINYDNKTSPIKLEHSISDLKENIEINLNKNIKKNTLLKATTLANSDDLNLHSPKFKSNSFVSIDVNSNNEREFEVPVCSQKKSENNYISKILEKKGTFKNSNQKSLEIIKNLTLKKQIVNPKANIVRKNNLNENEIYNNSLILQTYLTSLCFIGLKNIGNLSKNGNYKKLNLKMDKNNQEKINSIAQNFGTLILNRSRQVKEKKQNTLRDEICESNINFKIHQTTINSAISSNKQNRTNQNVNLLDFISNKKQKNTFENSFLENLAVSKKPLNSKENSISRNNSNKNGSNKNETTVKNNNEDIDNRTDVNLKESHRSNSKNHSNVNSIKEAELNIENSEQTLFIEYEKPSSYNTYRNFIIFLILILIGISVITNIMIYNSYSSIMQFYLIKNAFVRRNAILFDTYHYFKITIINREFLNIDIFKNNSLINIFDMSINNFDESQSLIRQYSNDGKISSFDLQTIGFFEDSLNGKYFCEYYVYFKNKTNLDLIINNIRNVPNLKTDDLENLKKIDKHFEKEFNECATKSGNLFSSGLDEFFNTVKYILTNTLTDFNNYKKNHIIYNEKEYEKAVFNYFSSQNMVKLNYCLRNVFFEVAEIYLKLIENSEQVFRNKINKIHFFTNYSLIIVFLIICILFLKIMVKLIYIPNRILQETEKIIKNSIFFKFV